MALVVGGATACEVNKIGPPDGFGAGDAPDTSVSPEAGTDAPGPTTCSPGPDGNIDADCPAGQFCQVQAGLCVECLVFESRCSASGARETCEAPVVEDGVLTSGGRFEPDLCGASSACVPDAQGLNATCEPKICEPLSSRCDPDDITTSRLCGGYGTRWFDKACESGKACRQGQCRPIRSDVLLVFDTSGSMLTPLPGMACGAQSGIPCPTDFPSCDRTAEPLTPMDLAKQVFTAGIVDAIEEHASFALQRFPQKVAGANSGNCSVGWYQSLAIMSGDDGSYETSEGGWFDQNRGEVIASPFPTRSDASNLDSLLAWMDREESLGPTPLACEVNADCASNRCSSTPDGPRCMHHTNPELRGGGGTPLGKSLFYAGEYLRRHVLVDGKACETSSDCQSANYVCRDSACVDERRHCREPTIVLFTDGAEGEVDDPFFTATVQAKRLRYGLGCDTDDDCASDAQCGTAGYCLPTQPIGNGAVTNFTIDGPANAVRAPDGRPLEITVHIVDLNAGAGGGVSKSIATNGGGFVYDVDTATPGEFEAKVKDALRVDPKCNELEPER